MREARAQTPGVASDVALWARVRDTGVMPLHAPLATVVEIRGPKQRVFRLARSVGEDALALETAAPFEPGRPVRVRFSLPDGQVLPILEARVEMADDEADPSGESGGSRLAFRDPPRDARQAVNAYVADRLGLPALP